MELKNEKKTNQKLKTKKNWKKKQETRANSTQNRAMRNLSVSAVNTALWNSPALGI